MGDNIIFDIARSLGLKKIFADGACYEVPSKTTTPAWPVAIVAGFDAEEGSNRAFVNDVELEEVESRVPDARTFFLPNDNKHNYATILDQCEVGEEDSETGDRFNNVDDYFVFNGLTPSVYGEHGRENDYRWVSYSDSLRALESYNFIKVVAEKLVDDIDKIDGINIFRINDALVDVGLGARPNRDGIEIILLPRVTTQPEI